MNRNVLLTAWPWKVNTTPPFNAQCRVGLYTMQTTRSTVLTMAWHGSQLLQPAQSNSPGEALHVGASSVAIQLPVPDISEITGTQTRKEYAY